MDIALQSVHAENQDSATASQGEGNTIGQPMNIGSKDEMELGMARMALHTHTHADTDQNKDSAITEIEEDELDEQPMKQRTTRHGKGRVRTRYVCV